LKAVKGTQKSWVQHVRSKNRRPNYSRLFFNIKNKKQKLAGGPKKIGRWTKESEGLSAHFVDFSA
jgi:hypothetical protein